MSAEKKTYSVTITEINKQIVEVEANSKEEAIAIVESDYWQHANDYCLEPEDTFFE